mgnify:CR=1 FL=1
MTTHFSNGVTNVRGKDGDTSLFSGIKQPLITGGYNQEQAYQNDWITFNDEDWDITTAGGSEFFLPEYAGVANAIGAVVGKITMREMGVVSSPSEGKYLVHFDGKPVNFNNEEDALKTLAKKLTQKSIAKAKEAGAENVSVNIDREVKTAKIENRSVFVEARILVEASGRPRISKS